MVNLSLTLVFLALCTLIFSSSVTAAVKTNNFYANVAFVISHDKAVYRKIVSVSKQIATENKMEKSKILFDTFNTNIWNKLSKKNKNQYTLVVSVGSHACSILLKKSKQFDFNVLCTFIPKLAFQEQILKYQIPFYRSQKLSVIYLNQPILRQAELVKQLLPSAKRIGTIVSTLDLEAAKRLKISVKRSGLTLDILLFNKNTTSEKELKRLINTNDAILALPDPIVHSPRLAKWMLYNTYREKKPIIAFSQSYIRAGALAAIYSTPEQIGRQIGEQIVSRINNDQLSYNKMNDPRYYSVAVNRTVTKSLGLRIPDELKIKNNIEKKYFLYKNN